MEELHNEIDEIKRDRSDPDK